MADDDLLDHSDESKHLQLGADPSLDDRTPMSAEEREAAWADATTVEQFKIDIEELAKET